MAEGFCARCRATVEMTETVTRRRVRGEDGAERTVTERSWHCETCGAFVRSETTAGQPAGIREAEEST